MFEADLNSDNTLRLVTFEFEGEGMLCFDPRCTKCARFLRHSSFQVQVNMAGETRATAECKRCGQIESWNMGWL